MSDVPLFSSDFTADKLIVPPVRTLLNEEKLHSIAEQIETLVRKAVKTCCSDVMLIIHCNLSVDWCANVETMFSVNKSNLKRIEALDWSELDHRTFCAYVKTVATELNRIFGDDFKTVHATKDHSAFEFFTLNTHVPSNMFMITLKQA